MKSVAFVVGFYLTLLIAGWAMLGTVGVGSLVTIHYAASKQPPPIHFSFTINRKRRKA